MADDNPLSEDLMDRIMASATTYSNSRDRIIASSSATTPASTVNTPYFGSNAASTPQTTASSPPAPQESIEKGGEGAPPAQATASPPQAPPYKHLPTDYSTISTEPVKIWVTALDNTPLNNPNYLKVRQVLEQQAALFLNEVKQRFITALTCPYCGKVPISANIKPTATHANEQGHTITLYGAEWDYWCLIWVELESFEELNGQGMDIDDWLRKMQAKMQWWEVLWWEKVLKGKDAGKCVVPDVGVDENAMLNSWIPHMGE